MEQIQFLALGGAREIGANAYFYRFGGYGLLVDSGLHPEKTGWDAFPKAELLEPYAVNSFIITHSHTDHLGGMPFLLQSQPQARVIATPETIEIARIMLANSCSLLPRQHPTEVMDKLPFYTHEKIDEIIRNIEPRKINTSFELQHSEGSKITCSFFKSGHILGAVGMLLEYNGKRIFHTGDTSLHTQHLIGGADLPDKPVDVVVTECTNGKADAYLSQTREKELHRLEETITRTLESGGSVLIPVFALGKMQEALAMLWDAMRAKRIPTVDIYNGGMGRRIANIYDQFAYSDSRLNHEEVLADIPTSEIPRREELFSGKYFKTPSIVLASSGMMQTGTSSYFLAQRWLRQKNFAICFIGYTDPRTPGYVVSHAEPGQRIKFGSMKREVPVRCAIERFRFSAHARREELLEIITRLKPKHVVLTHGDTDAMNAFSELIIQTLPGTKVSAPENGKSYNLLQS
ncbi:MAG: MBL fold metallo-hydrolase [Ignavibacteriota bacterium]